MLEVKLNANALALAGAALSALSILVISLLGAMGIYEEAVFLYADWFELYELTPLGTVAGMVEAFLWTFIGLSIFAWIYNGLVAGTDRENQR